MEISKDTQNVVGTVESFTEKELLKKNDFSLLVELSATFNHIESFSQAVFNGTAFFKLSKKLNKVDPSEESAANFKKEFEYYLEMFKANLQEIAKALVDEDLKKRLQETYFELTRGCVLNLIDLAHDFALFKQMQTSNKER